eukprot:1623057-Amphidinium_carterae.1
MSLTAMLAQLRQSTVSKTGLMHESRLSHRCVKTHCSGFQETPRKCISGVDHFGRAIAMSVAHTILTSIHPVPSQCELKHLEPTHFAQHLGLLTQGLPVEGPTSTPAAANNNTFNPPPRTKPQRALDP